MLNLFQHPTCKSCNMLMKCPEGSRNKFGMTDFLIQHRLYIRNTINISHKIITRIHFKIF